MLICVECWARVQVCYRTWFEQSDDGALLQDSSTIDAEAGPLSIWCDSCGADVTARDTKSGKHVHGTQD